MDGRHQYNHHHKNLSPSLSNFNSHCHSLFSLNPIHRQWAAATGRVIGGSMASGGGGGAVTVWQRFFLTCHWIRRRPPPPPTTPCPPPPSATPDLGTDLTMALAEVTPCRRRPLCRIRPFPSPQPPDPSVCASLLKELIVGAEGTRPHISLSPSLSHLRRRPPMVHIRATMVHL